MAIEVPAQRLEIGDVVVLHLPGEDGAVEAKLVRDIERTPTIVRARYAWARARISSTNGLSAISSRSFAALEDR
ncbi:MAG: hypothetical protein ACJ75Q_06750 [Gaiellaceae bacterium]